MVCSTCGRPCVEPSCAGCKTLSRIKRLWENQALVLNEASALTCLRNCAGELADLCEGGSSAPVVVPLSGIPPAPREDPKGGGSKEKKRKEREAGGRDPTPPLRVKEEPTGGGGDPVRDLPVEEEESEESSEAVIDEPVVPAPPPPRVELTEGERARRYSEARRRSSDSPAPLGLRPLPVRLSAPSQDGVGLPAPPEERPSGHHRERRSSSTRPRADREVPGGETTEGRPRSSRDRRARTPSYPPPVREDRRRDGRNRSRSQHKKKKSKGSKGVKKRERGRTWIEDQRKAQKEQQWHQRR